MFVQALARGVIDLRRADPNKSGWWTKTHVLLQALERNLLAEKDAFWHRQQLAIISNSIYTKESRDRAWEAASQSIENMDRLQRPWAHEEQKTTTRSSVDELTAAWAAAFGDPHDPVVAAKITATADWLMRTSKTSPRTA